MVSTSGGWELSPGYDPAITPMFDRVATAQCVFCHVGSIAVSAREPNRYKIVDASIGCERCHGPGRDHVQKQNGLVGQGLIDSSIVNPAKLDRELSDAICAQCHLQGDQSVNAFGTTRWDFVPGEPLGSVTTEYRAGRPPR